MSTRRYAGFFVAHIAGPASPIDYVRPLLHTPEVSSYGTLNAVGLATLNRALLDGLHIWRLLRPVGAPSARELQRRHQPRRAARGVCHQSNRHADALTMAAGAGRVRTPAWRTHPTCMDRIPGPEPGGPWRRSSGMP
jgi:hypothetical protein